MKSTYKPFIPIYNRDGNTLARYTYQTFTTRTGDTGFLRIANYNDNKGASHTCVAQVLWDKG